MIESPTLRHLGSLASNFGLLYSLLGEKGLATILSGASLVTDELMFSKFGTSNSALGHFLVKRQAAKRIPTAL